MDVASRAVGSSCFLSCQEHPSNKKQLSTLKESMLKASPFPRLHAKAAETKGMLEPTSAALQYFRSLDPAQSALIDTMVAVVDASHSIDVLVDGLTGYKVHPVQGHQLEALVQEMNVGITKLCHTFHGRGIFLFNFVPQKPLHVPHSQAWDSDESQAGLVLHGGRPYVQNEAACTSKLQRHRTKAAWSEGPEQIPCWHLLCTVSLLVPLPGKSEQPQSSPLSLTSSQIDSEVQRELF